MGNCILVIGAVLLDIVGKAADDQSSAEDKIGNVDFAVGGVAFNVAVNLTQLGHECQLFTCLRAESPVSRLLKASIATTGVKLDYIIEEDHIPDAAHIALFSGLSMNAVTSSPIDRTNILVSGRLRSAISQAKMVIADTNLSSDQIKIVHGICIESGVDLCIVSASDAKTSRIMESRNINRNCALVAMNEREARSLDVIVDGSIDYNAVRARFCSERVLLSRGAKGAIYLDSNGVHHIPAPNIVPVNTVGAGDSLFAAICVCLLERKNPYDGDGLAIIVDTVSHVLGKTGPNMGDSRIVSAFKPKSDTITGSILVVFTLMIFIVGLTFGLQGVWQHWVSTIAASAITGAVGTFIYNIAKGSRRDSPGITNGLVLGAASVIISLLPNLAGGDLIDPKKLNEAQMIVHFLSSTCFSLFAGLCLSRAVDRLLKQTVEG